MQSKESKASYGPQKGDEAESLASENCCGYYLDLENAQNLHWWTITWAGFQLQSSRQCWEKQTQFLSLRGRKWWWGSSSKDQIALQKKENFSDPTSPRAPPRSRSNLLDPRLFLKKVMTTAFLWSCSGTSIFLRLPAGMIKELCPLRRGNVTWGREILSFLLIFRTLWGAFPAVDFMKILSEKKQKIKLHQSTKSWQKYSSRCFVLLL